MKNVRESINLVVSYMVPNRGKGAYCHTGIPSKVNEIVNLALGDPVSRKVLFQEQMK